MALALLALPALAWDWSNPNINASTVPSRYFRAEVLQAGVGSLGLRIGLLQFDFVDGRFRAGAKLFDIWRGEPGWGPMDQVALVHVGLTLASLPARVWGSFWARPLDVYLQGNVAIGNALSSSLDWKGPVANLELCADADFTAGVGLFGGVMARQGPNRDWDAEPYFGLRIRLATLAAALNEPGEATDVPGLFQ